MLETLGKFKLKDKLERRTIKIAFPNDDTGRLLAIYIEKVIGSNNEFVVGAEWNYQERIPDIDNAPKKDNKRTG